jgi:hypothetical protein
VLPPLPEPPAPLAIQETAAPENKQIIPVSASSTATPPTAVTPAVLRPEVLANTQPIPPAASEPKSPLRALYQQAVESYGRHDCYVMYMRRREQVNGRNQPEEILQFKFRKEPWSVHFKWLGKEGKNREVVYVKGKYEGKIHTLTAAGDIPFMGAGSRVAVLPDSAMVRSHSRHAITEAGIGALLDQFGRVLNGAERGDPRFGSLRYLGILKRDEFDNAVEAVLQTIPRGSEPALPRGGQRLWFFDLTLHFPVLVITNDQNNLEVEYYCHERFEFPERLSDDDFNPAKMGKR